MHQMAQSSVFLSGMGGLGIEMGRLNVTLLHNSTVRYLIPYHMIFIAGCGLTLSNLTSGFTAKNIVLAGVKVCTLTKYIK